MIKNIFFFLPLISALRMNMQEITSSMNFPNSFVQQWAPIEEMHVPGGGAPVIWQRPRGELKGILLWVHGCGGRATNMFTKEGTDGHRIKMCTAPCSDGESFDKMCCLKSEEDILTRLKARHRGYLVVSVQAGYHHETRCPYIKDVQRISQSLEYVKLKENVLEKPIIVAGHSAGGGWAPIISSFVGGNCTVMGAAAARKGGQKWDENGHMASLGFPNNYPKTSPVFFIHQKEDLSKVKDTTKTLSGYIDENMKELSHKGVQNSQISVDSIAGEHANIVGAYMDEAIDFCETGKNPSKTISKPLTLKEWQRQMGYVV